VCEESMRPRPARVNVVGGARRGSPRAYTFRFTSPTTLAGIYLTQRKVGSWPGDVNLFRYRQRIVRLDPEIPNSALDLCMTQ
jgi:hypothetical protein